jgi:uncharacterized MnhB-related membrane protein
MTARPPLDARDVALAEARAALFRVLLAYTARRAAVVLEAWGRAGLMPRA